MNWNGLRGPAPWVGLLVLMLAALALVADRGDDDAVGTGLPLDAPQGSSAGSEIAGARESVDLPVQSDPDLRSALAARSALGAEVLDAPAGADDLVVVVVDSTGSPVRGVPVEYVLVRRLGGEDELVLASATTRGEVGRATFEGSLISAWRERSAEYQLGFAPRVRVALPFRPPVQRELGPEREPDGTVRLEIPGFSWLTVTPEPAGDDASGSPPDVHHLTWERVDPGAHDIVVHGAAGELLVGPLGCDWRVRIRAWGAARTWPIGETIARSPATPGDLSQVSIVVSSAVEVTGRAVRPSGEVLAGATLVAIMTGGGDKRTGFTKTDGEGSFRVHLDGDFALETLELRGIEGGAGAYKGLAHVEPGSGLEVGTITLATPDEQVQQGATVLQGFVWNEAGEPVEGAVVRPWGLVDDEVVPLPSALSAPDGSFSVVSEVPVGLRDLSVSVTAAGYVETTMDDVGVDSSVRVSLEEGATLSGSVAVPDWVPLDQITIQRAGGGTTNRRVLADWVGELPLDGEAHPFLWTGLKSGAESIQVGIRGATWVLSDHRVEVVRPSAATLSPVDLRARLRLIELSLLGTEGPLADAVLEVTGSSGKGYSSLRSGQDGRVLFLLPVDEEAIRVSTAGHTDVALEPVSQTVLFARD